MRVRLPDGKIGRPVLTAWMDWRTRRVTGRVVESYGDATTITAAIHHGITDAGNIGGPPRIAWVDNGRDYLSLNPDTEGPTRRKRIEDADVPRLRGIYAMLGMDLHLALPHGPRGKARIERFFQTKGKQLDAFLPGYRGPAPEHRPESLAKLEKESPETLLTLDEYRRHVEHWISEYNASADHCKDDLTDDRGRKLSPDEAMRRWCVSRRGTGMRCASALRRIYDQTGVPVIFFGSAEVFKIVDDRDPASGGGQLHRRCIMVNMLDRAREADDPDRPGRLGRGDVAQKSRGGWKSAPRSPTMACRNGTEPDVMLAVR